LEIKCPHQGDVGFGKALAMTGGEISRQPLPEFVTIRGSYLASLLKLDDAATDLPISGGEESIDRLRGRTTCSA
jgi:hypothetical protein